MKDQGLLCVTATDVGVLSGKYPIKCVRRYGALPQKFPYRFEVGIRILISLIARYALSMDYGIQPLASFLDGHYYRVCALILKDRSYALETLKNLGYAYYRSGTLRRGFIPGYPIPSITRYRLAGPLWIGNLWDAEFLVNYFMRNIRDYFSSRAKEIGMLITDESLGPNIPYALTTEVGKDLGRELPINDIINVIRGLGYQAVRSHFHIKGFRTNADLLRIREIIMGK
nr:hypothetical protein [Vulcanisaeta sp. JCM 16159]